jgi:hypothetical protein
MTDEFGSAAFDSLADATSAGEDERPVLGAVFDDVTHFIQCLRSYSSSLTTSCRSQAEGSVREGVPPFP